MTTVCCILENDKVKFFHVIIHKVSGATMSLIERACPVTIRHMDMVMLIVTKELIRAVYFKVS